MSVMRQELEQFLGGYFHQDWMLDATDAAQIVDRYVAQEPAERVRAAARELADLLATTGTEEALRAVVIGELGCFYSPDGTMREWLEGLQTRLEGAVAEAR